MKFNPHILMQVTCAIGLVALWALAIAILLNRAEFLGPIGLITGVTIMTAVAVINFLDDIWGKR